MGTGGWILSARIKLPVFAVFILLSSEYSDLQPRSKIPDPKFPISKIHSILLMSRSALRVKICGITTADQAIAISQLGITTLGFICVQASPRWIEPEQIGAIAQALTPTPNRHRIGVFAQPSLETLAQTVRQGQLTGIQLHGDESLALAEAVRDRFPELELIKACRIREAADLELAQQFSATVDRLLLDAYHPTLLGGTGHSLDWKLLQTFAPPVPWLLAGGLTPDNVIEALSQVQPGGIDLSSGVEQSPGLKDLAQVQRLCHNLRTVAEIC